MHGEKVQSAVAIEIGREEGLDGGRAPVPRKTWTR
jgi:hypothetical protein